MADTATPETGPVDAPASNDSIANQIAADLEAGGGAPADGHEAIVQELVNEAEGASGETSSEEPAAEADATEPANEAEEAPEGTPATDEQLITVKVNGEERQVPLSEAIAGYSRTEDYKAKTAAVAEERRQVEAQKATLEPTLKAQYANQLEEATNAFAQFDPVLSEARTINWEALKATNPAAFVQAQDAVNARVQLFEQMKQRVATARQEANQAQAQQAQQEQAQRFDLAASKIVEANPELADTAKFQDFASKAIDHLKGLGFQPDEIASSLDDRVLTLADKARRWDAYQAAQKSLPDKKVVQKSAVRPLTTDAGSRATPPRFPKSLSREGQMNWIANQILSDQSEA